MTYSQFGSPDALRLADVDEPIPKEREVLVRVRAASANPLDWHFIRGEPRIMRLQGKPNSRIPGADFPGTVTAVGANVTQFRIGDDVFGACLGAFAEYACASVDAIARKPGAIGFEQAAAIPVAGCTALIAVRDQARLQPGQTVLIDGASGGIGTFAVQIAKALGGIVTGVCSTRNVELVRSLGAERVIDYTVEDFAAGGPRYDVVLHIAGNRSRADHRRALMPDGTLVLVGAGTGRDMGGHSQLLETLKNLAVVSGQSLLGRLVRQRVRMFVGKVTAADLAYLANLCEARKLTPVVERCYALADAAEAIRVIEGGHARGKVIVTP